MSKSIRSQQSFRRFIWRRGKIFNRSFLLNFKCFFKYFLQGALNGAGASTFGFGSDIGGSIRLPSMFCGVFGHKPTGGLLSIKGSFPYSDDPAFAQYLASGPMTRFAKDLPILMQIMAGEDVQKLKFDKPIQLKNIKVWT